MGDSVVAEKARLEPSFAKGATQSSCYSYRFFGYMIAGPLSTGLYKWVGPGSVILLLSVLPLSILPLVFMLGEVRHGEVRSTKEQCQEIWSTVCSRSVWQPLAFVYIYNVLQVGNSAWNQYLKTTLLFTSTQINLIYIASSVLLYLGIITYKYFMINWSWRLVYVLCTLLNGVFSAMQILLILDITFGLSPFYFALGDDAFAEFLAGIQFLPTTIMVRYSTEIIRSVCAVLEKRLELIPELLFYLPNAKSGMNLTGIKIHSFLDIFLAFFPISKLYHFFLRW